MPIDRRYGVQDTVYFRMIKRSVVDFATSSDWTPVQSDARVQIDGASESYATNVVTATGSRWALVLTATEHTGKKIGVTIIDAATKAVEDQGIEIETYGSPLAQHAFDRSVSTVTLSQPALDAAATQIVNTVWATGSRTLSSFGTLQADIVNNVWATPSRTLSSFGTLQGDIVNNVWATGSRTLSSFGTLQGDIVHNVWATPSRQLGTVGQNQLADVILRRSYATAHATTSGDTLTFRSLLGATAKLVNMVDASSTPGSLLIMHEDDATTFGTQTVTTDSAAAPITKLDTV